MKIILERQKCIGCGSCESLCPKYWQMGQDGKIKLLGSQKKAGTENFELTVKEVGCTQEAADSCPVQCIKIEK
jgi:ferredoxin